MLGERLLDRGFITERQLDLAMREQRRTGSMLGEILTQLGLVTHQSIASVLAEQGGVTFLDLTEADITPAALALLPEPLARRLSVLPVALEDGVLVLAMANIYDVEALGEVEALTRRRVRVVGASEEDILAHINEAYGHHKSIEELIEEAIQASAGPDDNDPGGLPVVRLVDQLLVKAIIKMARSFQMTTIAEGVETPGALNTLRHLGCHEVQGYLTGRPGPLDDVLARADEALLATKQARGA